LQIAGGSLERLHAAHGKSRCLHPGSSRERQQVSHRVENSMKDEFRAVKLKRGRLELGSSLRHRPKRKVLAFTPGTRLRMLQRGPARLHPHAQLPATAAHSASGK